MMKNNLEPRQAKYEVLKDMLYNLKQQRQYLEVLNALDRLTNDSACFDLLDQCAALAKQLEGMEYTLNRAVGITSPEDGSDAD